MRLSVRRIRRRHKQLGNFQARALDSQLQFSLLPLFTICYNFFPSLLFHIFKYSMYWVSRSGKLEIEYNGNVCMCMGESKDEGGGHDDINIIYVSLIYNFGLVSVH